MIGHALVPACGDVFGEAVRLRHDPIQQLFHVLLIVIPLLQQRQQILCSVGRREGGRGGREGRERREGREGGEGGREGREGGREGGKGEREER